VWNQLPADALGTLSCKQSNSKQGVRKVINEVKSICGGNYKKKNIRIGKPWHSAE
jgi:hypothetical protein